MSSWLSSLVRTRRAPYTRSRKNRGHSLNLLVESLEERAVPAAFLTYSTIGSSYSQAFNTSMPSDTTAAPNIAYTTAGPFDLSAQTGYTATAANLSGWL